MNDDTGSFWIGLAVGLFFSGIIMLLLATKTNTDKEFLVKTGHARWMIQEDGSTKFQMKTIKEIKEEKDVEKSSK